MFRRAPADNPPAAPAGLSHCAVLARTCLAPSRQPSRCPRAPWERPRALHNAVDLLEVLEPQKSAHAPHTSRLKLFTSAFSSPRVRAFHTAPSSAEAFSSTSRSARRPQPHSHTLSRAVCVLHLAVLGCRLLVRLALHQVLEDVLDVGRRDLEARLAVLILSHDQLGPPHLPKEPHKVLVIPPLRHLVHHRVSRVVGVPQQPGLLL
mmetsp:Transcript_14001/g.34199  ORF Transcript_14001/g.34199 Transcript_14001/m.34199 type:complete len:206 (-) Transcript_14001:1398-2015(-)